MAKQQAAAMLVALSLVVVVTAAASAGGASAAQQCNATELAVCAPAIIGGSAPTESCCSNLRAQEPCFCQYVRDPAYSRYVTSPNARTTLAACGIVTPTCLLGA